MRSGVFEAVMGRGLLGLGREAHRLGLRLFGVSLLEGPERRPF